MSATMGVGVKWQLLRATRPPAPFRSCPLSHRCLKARTAKPTQDQRTMSGHLVTATDSLQEVLENNRKWSEEQKANNPEFFSKLANVQTPQWLWIGCSDSRVPANQLMGLGPGEVFVQRNVGNLVTHKDMNAMSCLEYAVTALKVRHIIICGHHDCGAIKGALSMPITAGGLVNLWIQDIRETRDRNADELQHYKGIDQVNKLAELNVLRQVFNLCSSPVVQAAWANGQPLSIHGVIYALEDGLLKELAPPITCVADVEEYAKSKLGDLRHLSRNLLQHLNFQTTKA